ncbi:MAG: class I SAM-dependent methyltransferase [Planctomycetota bacterium]
MTFDDGRRTYYDHEALYERIVAKDGVGWDDLNDDAADDSYEAVTEFLESEHMKHLSPGKPVLDLGCGGGQVAIMLAQRGFAAFGVDFSPTAIDLANTNCLEHGIKAEFAVGDCLGLDEYADRSMDAVIDNHVWHCIIGERDRQKFLSSIWRVLRDGGIFFSETMTRQGDFDPDVVNADPVTFVCKHQSRYWASEAEILSSIAGCGFDAVFQQLCPQEETPGGGSTLVVYARKIPQ